MFLEVYSKSILLLNWKLDMEESNKILFQNYYYIDTLIEGKDIESFNKDKLKEK